MLLAKETITDATKEHADQDSTDTLIPPSLHDAARVSCIHGRED